MDAPTFSSVEELLESADDREGWRLLISCLLPDKDKKKRVSKTEAAVVAAKMKGGSKRMKPIKGVITIRCFLDRRTYIQ